MTTNDRGLFNRFPRVLRSSEGSQLLEFGLALPALLLLVAGIWDFGSSFELRAQLTNAAREGARIVVSNPLNNPNCTTSTPCPIVAAASAVQNYLTNAGLPASCITPSSPTTTSATTREWTWSCSNGTSLIINRGATVTQGTVLLPSTQVTLTYPIKWKRATFLPRTRFPSTISSTSTMENLTGAS